MKLGANAENETGGREGEEPKEVELSGALVEDLTAHQNRGPASSARDSPRGDLLQIGTSACNAKPYI